MNARMISNEQQHDRIWLWALVLVALGLRIVLALLPRAIRWDEPDYLWLGKNLLTGVGYTIVGVPELHYTPLLPILSGAVYVLTGDPELGTSVWYVLLGALVVLPVYGLARRIYGRPVARLAGILVALFPALSSAILYWGTMTEPLFIFCIYCALWMAIVALDERKWWAYALTGTFVSLAYLSRPEGIIWAAALGAFFILVWIKRRRLWRWRTLGQAAAYVALFVALAIPYAVYMHAHTGKWMATGKLGITYDIGEAVLARDPVMYDQVTASLDPDSGEILWWSSKRFDRTMLQIVAQDPRAFVTRIWQNLQRLVASFFAPNIVPFFLLGPIILGWVRQPWNQRRLRNEGLLWFGILPVLSFLPFHIEIRFFSPAMPALLIWVAAGLWAMGAWFAETAAQWRSEGRAGETMVARGETVVSQPETTKLGVQSGAVLVLLALLLVYVGWMHWRTIDAGMRDLSYAHKRAGLWLKSNAPYDASIMSRDLAVSLYAERQFVVSPRAEYAEYLDYARRKGATYLLVDERELRTIRPHLSFLLDDANPPSELEHVYSSTDDRGRTIVYRIKD
jgi:4-amino-4-deoxy-L-arabinose transferase-like glycosyltransferase